MIRRDPKSRTVAMDRDDFRITLSYARGMELAEWRFPGPRSASHGLPLEFPALLFALRIGDSQLTSRDFTVREPSTHVDRVAHSVTLNGDCAIPAATLRARVSLMVRGGELPRFIIQLAAQWLNGIPQVCHISVPFLAQLAATGVLRPASQLSGSGQYPAELAWKIDDAPPWVVSDPENGAAIGLDFPTSFPHWSNFNRHFQTVRQSREIAEHEFYVKPTRTLTDAVDMQVIGSASGWPGIFAGWKAAIRERYDLRRYATEGASWAQRAYLHHFTYAFGNEAYDYENDLLRVDGVLDDGEAFGGYDAIIYWHQYPRLGLDERTQWDLYDELPNGRSEIKEIARRCHNRGARLLLPFKPWDVRPGESLNDQAVELRRLVEECDVDGFFLDTMSTIPESFARLQRDDFPELLFASEGTPNEPRQLEQIVCSWDQRGRVPEPVNVDLLRFLLPEHPRNMICRWSVGTAKDELVRRAILNGTGLVIWQDVFGSWLPYSDEQKGLIKRWKSVLSEHHELFFGDRSIPLYPIKNEMLIANHFASSANKDCILTVYNRGASRFEAKAIKAPTGSPASVQLLLGTGHGPNCALLDADTISLSLDAGEVAVIHARG